MHGCLAQRQAILEGIQEAALLLLLEIGANMTGPLVVHRKILDQRTSKRCPCGLRFTEKVDKLVCLGS